MQSKSRSSFSLYWWAYGGWSALWGSVYLRFSIVFNTISFNTWSNAGWWDISVGALPTMLGFTVAGFAVFIGFGDDGFRSQLVEIDDEDSEEPSSYIKFCASFVHFIVIQSLALILALLGKSWDFYSELMNPVRDFLPYINTAFGFFGYGLFIYSVATIVAISMHFLNLAEIYREYKKFISEGND